MANSKPSYWRIFREHYGEGPFDCYFCNEPVEDFYGKTTRCRMCPVIHHINGDHDDNEPANLTAMHHGCHTRLHEQRRARACTEHECQTWPWCVDECRLLVPVVE